MNEDRTFVGAFEAPTTAIISVAFPRMTVGFSLISSMHFSVRNRVAPTPTGSKTQGLESSFARVAATFKAKPNSPSLVSRTQIPPKHLPRQFLSLVLLAVKEVALSSSDNYGRNMNQAPGCFIKWLEKEFTPLREQDFQTLIISRFLATNSDFDKNAMRCLRVILTSVHTQHSVLILVLIKMTT